MVAGVLMAVVAGGAKAAAAAVLALAPPSEDRRESATCAAPPVAAQVCAVCLSELVAGEAACSGEPAAAAVRTLPRCGHGFHAECIGRWLPLRPECPLCRRSVLPEGVADGEPATVAVAPAPRPEAAPAWSRPARMACGFGDGRVVWTRSPSVE